MKKYLSIFFLSAFIQVSYSQSFLYPQQLFPVQTENGKYGFTNEQGKLMVMPKYDQVLQESESRVAVKLGNKWGYINDAGREVIPLKYEEAGQYAEGLAPVKKGNVYGFIDLEGREVIDFKYEVALPFSQSSAAVRLNGKFGYIDRNGKIQIPFEFTEATSFEEGIAKVFKGELITEKQAFIDKQGKLVTDYIYDHNMSTYDSWNQVRTFQDGLLLVSKGGKRGYINNKGKEIIPAKYYYLSPMHNGWAAYYMRDAGQWGILHKSGRELTMPIFDEVSFQLLDEGYPLIVTIRNGTGSSPRKYGLFSTGGEYNLTLPYYDAILDIKEGMIPVVLNGKHGFLDSTGRTVVEPKYDDVYEFSNGTAAVSVNGKWGIINKTGKVIVPVKYEGVNNFSEGLAAVQADGKVGFVDMNGREVIAPKYQAAMPFVNGIAAVALEKSGYIDKTGKAVTELRYDDAMSFSGDHAVVLLDGKYGVINRSGKQVIAPTFEMLVLFENDLFFTKDKKWGIMKTDGTIMVPAQFDSILQPFMGDTAVAMQNGKAVYIDKTGKVIAQLNQ